MMRILKFQEVIATNKYYIESFDIK